MSAVPPHTAGEVPPRHPTVHGALPAPEKRGPLSVLVSVCLHLLLIWILVMVTAVVADPEATREIVAFLSPALMPGGGGGGGNYGAVKVATPPPPPEVKPKPIVPPPPPIVPTVVPTTVPPVTPVVEPPVSTAVAAAPGVAAAGTGGGTGGGNGTGTGTGNGSGVGPGSGSGSGGGEGAGGKKNVAPQSRQLILPPLDGTPKDLRGKAIEVSFLVEPNGTVSKVTTDPFIKDKKFNKTFDDTMKGYRWEPGRDSTGKKVAMIATITITLN